MKCTRVFDNEDGTVRIERCLSLMESTPFVRREIARISYDIPLPVEQVGITIDSRTGEETPLMRQVPREYIAMNALKLVRAKQSDIDTIAAKRKLANS